MGCDIHIMLEQRHNGRWIGIWYDGAVEPKGRVMDLDRKDQDYITNFYSYSDVGGRNYAFFARLAGVRGEGPPAKGLPGDISDWAQMECEHWGKDGHSHSWDTLLDFTEKYYEDEDVPEFKKIVREKLGRDDEKLCEQLSKLWGIRFGEDGNIKPEDFRVIYWFDN